MEFQTEAFCGVTNIKRIIYGDRLVEIVLPYRVQEIFVLRRVLTAEKFIAIIFIQSVRNPLYLISIYLTGVL